MDAKPSPLPSSVPPPFSDLSAGLEEVCAMGPRDMASALAFSLGRLPRHDPRGVALVASRAWVREYGRPYGPGLASLGQGGRLLLVMGATERELLWAMEQGLRSGALAAVLGAIEETTLAQSQRLTFAAREGRSVAVMLRAKEGGLSTATRRWRITTLPSSGDPFDASAPGPMQLSAELKRSRGERPGVWRLEQDDETHRLRLADRLADIGLVAGRAAGATSDVAA